MTGTNDQMIRRVIEREGGYVDHPADRGGPTKYGITGKTLKHWREQRASQRPNGEPVGMIPKTSEEMREAVQALTEREAITIYEGDYLLRYHIGEIPDMRLREALFDAVVNHGPRAIYWLQKAANTTADGLIGPNTLAAIDANDPHALLTEFVKRRLCFITRSTEKNPANLLPFLTGLVRRAFSHMEE